MFLDGPPNHIRSFENRTKKCPRSPMFRFWVLSMQIYTELLMFNHSNFASEKILLSFICFVIATEWIFSQLNVISSTVGIWIPKLLGIQMIEKRLDANWFGFWMPFEYRTAQPFAYWTYGCHLVFLSTGLVFKWSVWYIGHSP